MIASTSSRDANLSLAILNLWVKRNSYKTYSPLDVVAISLEASAAPSAPKSPFSRQVNSKQTVIKKLSRLAPVFCKCLSGLKIMRQSNIFGRMLDISGNSHELNPQISPQKIIVLKWTAAQIGVRKKIGIHLDNLSRIKNFKCNKFTQLRFERPSGGLIL